MIKPGVDAPAAQASRPWQNWHAACPDAADRPHPLLPSVVVSELEQVADAIRTAAGRHPAQGQGREVWQFLEQAWIAHHHRIPEFGDMEHTCLIAQR